jgi:folate-dependent phosphoribosylglycinamide formyltransferase PurN
MQGVLNGYENVPRPLDVCVFSSGGPGNLKTTWDCAQLRPDLLTLRLLVTDRPDIPAIDFARRHDIPVITRHFDAAFKGLDRDTATVVADRLHDEILHEIQDFECLNRPISLFVLAYRRIVRGALFRHISGRSINQHPADLSIRSPDLSSRLYRGIGGLKRSLQDGVSETCTCTIAVSKEADNGEILVRGPAIMVYENSANYIVHENMQKLISDRPALIASLLLIASGRILFSSERWEDGNRKVIVDGVEQSYGGYRAPSEDSLMEEWRED